MKKIYKEEEINVTMSIIFNLINNIEDYPKFLPWCKKQKSQKNQNTLKLEKSLSQKVL